MDDLLASLKRRRENLLERGNAVANETVGRGIDLLGKVQSGALEWKESLADRRRTLTEAERAWFSLDKIQVAVLDHFERLLTGFGERVRLEMERLRGLELRAVNPEPVLKKQVDAASDATIEDAEIIGNGRAAKRVGPRSSSAASKKGGARAETAAKTSASAAVKASGDKAAAKKKGNGTRKKSQGKAVAPVAASSATSEASETTKRLVLPIGDYENLTAKEVLAEIPRLSAAQCQAVYSFERSHRKRKTVLRALEARLPS